MKSLSLLASSVALLSATPVLAQAVGSNGFVTSPAARVYEPPHQSTPTPICAKQGATNRFYAVSLDCAGDARQRLGVGQLFPAGAGQPIGFAQLAPSLRAAYHVNPEQDYVLLDDFLYEMDHGTSKIRRVMPVVIAR